MRRTKAPKHLYGTGNRRNKNQPRAVPATGDDVYEVVVFSVVTPDVMGFRVLATRPELVVFPRRDR